MSNLQFITCLFGERYLPFLVTNLYSLRKHHPESMYVVAYGDISEEVIDPIRFAYPEAMFVRMDIKIKMKENKSRLNNKLAFWWNAYQNKFADNVCFIDVDTLLVRPIPSRIFDQEFDIGVTYCDNENPKFPINTGVFLAKRTEETDILMKAWLRGTNAFINVPKSFSAPFKKYGSGDQLALMLALKEPKRFHKITWHTVDSHKVRCLWLPTTDYNNSYSTSVTRNIHILHYKSRWHSILLDSVPIESIETRKEYGEIYDFYQKAKTEAYSVLG
jgi:hypothetical protein